MLLPYFLCVTNFNAPVNAILYTFHKNMRPWMYNYFEHASAKQYGEKESIISYYKGTSWAIKQHIVHYGV